MFWLCFPTQRPPGATKSPQEHPPGPRPGRPATHGPHPKPRKTRRFRATDPSKRLRFNLTGPPRDYQGNGPKELEKSVEDSTEHPKGPQRDPKNNKSRRYGGPFWMPLAVRGGTPREARRHPWGSEGTAKTAPNKNPEPLNKKRRGQEKDNKQGTPNLIIIYKGFAVMPFGGVFLETPRHEENSKMRVLLQFGIPGGAKAHENLVVYKGF